MDFSRPRAQATIDLILYIRVLHARCCRARYGPAITTRLIHGAINEHSNITAEGPPLYPFKTIIPLAGAIMLVQGIVEIVRCAICIKQGYWPSRQQDVEEVDVDKLKEMVRSDEAEIRRADRLIQEEGA